MTAKDQLLRARELGHELSIVERRGGAAYRLRCTCGYESTNRITKAQVNGVMVWHLSRVISADMAGDRINGR